MAAEADSRECGCFEGQIGFLVGTCVFLALFLVDRSALPDGRWGLAAVGFGLALAGAVVGKCIGMLRARRHTASPM